jgi:phosphate transport system substrate-binding protein
VYFSGLKVDVNMHGIIRILFSVCGLALLASLAWAQSGNNEVLKGPAFSDPSKVHEMPEGWAEKPIKYEAETEGADLVVTLNQHYYHWAVPLIEDFARERNLKIYVSEGSCGTSAGGIVDKSVDIAGFCCTPGEIDRLPGVEFHTLWVEPIALIVHNDNPIDDISLDDARRAFRGQVYKWSELGGKDITIQPIGRLHCKIRPGHWRLLLDNEDLFSPRLEEVGTIEDMVTVVAANPKAIGHVAVQWIDKYGEGKVKVLRLDGLDPRDLKNLESGRYPLYKVMDITTWKGKNLEKAVARELVDYLIERADSIGGSNVRVSASSLRKAGWKFEGDELVGEPE